VAIISNAVTMADAGAFSVGLGSMTHIKTLTVTATNVTTMTLINGASSVVLDDTYPIYIFEFVNIHSVVDDRNFTINFTADGTNFNVAKTGTNIRADHQENGGSGALAYRENGDFAQVTGAVPFGEASDGNADNCLGGRLILFNPSSTTFVKHFTHEITNNANYTDASGKAEACHVAGYCNTTSAITGFQLAAGGNALNGTIKLYGLKDS